MNIKKMTNNRKRKIRKAALDVMNSSSTSTTTTYSETMRWLKKNAPESMESFMKTYKDAFDEAMDRDVEDPESAAMLQALQAEVSPCSDRMYKMAQVVVHMGSPEIAGKGLADIVSFIMKKVPDASRPQAINNLRAKILKLNERNISAKAMPPTASFGQAITFIKTILNGHDSGYIKKVLTSISANLHH